MTDYIYKYVVKCSPMSDAFQALSRFECVHDIVDSNEEFEVYELLTQEDVSRLLDLSDGVIEYTVEKAPSD